MAKDSTFTEPEAPEADAAVADAAPENDAADVDSTEPQADPVEDTAPINDPADDPQPEFDASLKPDSGLEAPVSVTVPGLYGDLEPLPHPDDITDSDGNFLPGYDESTTTLVESEDGWGRPADAEQPEAVVPVDEFGRLELTEKPVQVPAAVARVLEGLPYVQLAEVAS